ncbi:MAG TPA: MBL fold metallo-hydrolase, partial [Patescibacteria group bacterium]
MRNIESAHTKPKLISYGATGGLVTGSCYRIDGRGSSFLVDAGLVQGKFEERSARGEIRNLTPADKIIGRSRVVFVTHAHIDHTGRLPILHKKGEGPKVFTTKLTATIMGTMLENSAQIQESDPKKQGLYTQDDVDKTMRNVIGFDPLARMPVDILGTDNHAQ